MAGKIRAFIARSLLTVKKYIFRNIGAYASEYSLEYLREKIFSMLSFLLSITMGPVMLYGAWLFYRGGNPVLAALEAISCAVILIIINTGVLSKYIKKVCTVLIFYVIGLILILYTGPSGAGLVSILFSFILALSFLGRKHNTILFCVNIAVTAAVTLLLYSGYLDSFNIVYYKPTWIINVLCLQLSIIAMYYVWDNIFSGLTGQLKLIEQSEEKYRMIAENTADVIWVLNAGTGKLTYISPSVEQARGYTAEEAMEQDLFDTMPPEDARKILADWRSSLALIEKEPGSLPVIVDQIRQYRKNGDLVWMEFSARFRFNESNELEAVGVSRDITERLRKEERIEYLSSHDPLTSLKNQNALRLFIRDADSGRTGSGTYSIIVIDIDSFRIVNDTLGHAAGDQMLIGLADHIRTAVGERGTVYRNAGDEFIVVIPSCIREEIRQISVELQTSISNQVKIKNRNFFLTASIGFCLGDTKKPLSDVLLDAGTALYMAKKKKNTIVAYDESMDQQKTRDTLLESDLNDALDKGEFELYFQPIIDVQSGAVDHAEALLRWNHPDYGMISPVEFIPIAERTKLIIPMTCWVINECCSKLNHWETLGIDNMELSINLSLAWFENRGSDISEFIVSTVRKAGVKPGSIKLEITESCLMYDPDEIISMFRTLKEQGLMLALDDFGTGYSSFGYMKDLPLDILKLDRSLTGVLDEDERDRMIVKTMITIAHGLDLQVVAEGVETVSQFEFLKTHDCDMIQGNLFSKPLSSDAFVEYYLLINKPKITIYN
jgi:diguanylate cyclase (GGDEF)-like protein/PAS domain S-box-containing protein